MKLTEDDRDHLHEKLVRLASLDPASGCWLYQGTQQTPSGIGVVRYRTRQYIASRVAAWLWCGRPFGLAGREVVVRRHHGCAPNCINPEHLRVVPVAAEKNHPVTTLHVASSNQPGNAACT